MRAVDYNNRTESVRGVNCTGNYTIDDARDQFCDFEIDDLRAEPGFHCTGKDFYGYNNNKPCVLLKINKVSLSSLHLLPLPA